MPMILPSQLLPIRLLMSTLFCAFIAADSIAGLNLNHRKCFWVQYGSDRCQKLSDVVSTNCGEFREMQIGKYASYVGTMIGLEGHLHRWTAPRENSFKGARKIKGTSKKHSRDTWCLVSPWVHWVHIRTR